MPTNRQSAQGQPQDYSQVPKTPEKGSWRLPISMVFSLATACLLAVIGGAVLLFVSTAANQQAGLIMRETGALIVGRGIEVVEDFFQNEERLGLMTADLLEDPIIFGAPQKVQVHLIRILSNQTKIRRISYTFSDGRQIRVLLDDEKNPVRHANVRPPSGLDVLRGNMQWKPPYYDEETGESFMQFIVYIENPVENTIARLAMDYPISLLSELMERIKWRESQVPFILLGKETVLASSEPAFREFRASMARPVPTIHDLKDTPLPSIWDPNPIRRLTDVSYEAHVDLTPQGNFLFLFKDLSANVRLPLIIGSYVPAAEFSGPLNNLHNVYLAAAGFLALGVIIMFILGRRMSKPIEQLAGQAIAIRELKMDQIHGLPRSHLREIDEANRAFNSAGVALNAFSRYVPKDLVRVLLDSDFQGLSSTELREMTILFSDIAGFTGVASKLSAEETTSLLNEHFQKLADSISKTNGTIDKYIGDGCMAFWGAPGKMEAHAQAAIEAVNIIAQKLELQLQGTDGEADALRIRIGVHTGTVVVGNIGARERMNYTVIGDAVNVAARLQELGKRVDPDARIIALASEATVRELPKNKKPKYLGEFRLRGREDAVDVYRIL